MLKPHQVSASSQKKKKQTGSQNSSPLSPLSQTLIDVINELWIKPESLNFQFPVDYKALGLIDYPLIVKHPMDLSTIKKKLQQNRYQNVQEFQADLQLIWDNCRLYNQENSAIYDQANSMQKLSKSVIKKHLKRLNEILSDQSTEHPSSTLSLDQKLILSQKIKLLSQPQLIQLISLLDEQPTKAIQDYNKDSFRVSLDELEVGLVGKINLWLDSIQDPL